MAGVDCVVGGANAFDDENWIPPYKPPARLDMAGKVGGELDKVRLAARRGYGTGQPFGPRAL